jgi:hypothetical protein
LWLTNEDSDLTMRRVWTLLGSRKNLKPENCLKMRQNPQRPMHALLGGVFGCLIVYRIRRYAKPLTYIMSSYFGGYAEIFPSNILYTNYTPSPPKIGDSCFFSGKIPPCDFSPQPVCPLHTTLSCLSETQTILKEKV